MTALQAFVLGLVQGLGEFLPISSSGHLIVVPWLLGWEDHGLAFDVALHLGTLAAVAFAFATIAAALALVVDWWLALLIVFGVLVLLTLILGLLARGVLKKGTPLAPEQAIEEARLTKQVLRSGHGG